MPQLLLLGGPPAIGKSTVAPLLADRLSPCAWLDADDVWRISPWRINSDSRSLVEANVTCVLRNYLEAGYPHVFLTWVLHREDLIERLVRPLRDLADRIAVVHLTATPKVLGKRLRLEPERGRSPALALERLEEIVSLPYPQLDTTDRKPDEIADQLLHFVRKGSFDR